MPGGPDGRKPIHPGEGRRHAVPHPKGRVVDPRALDWRAAFAGIFNADFHGAVIPHTRPSLWIHERHRAVSQPRYGEAIPIQRGLAEDRVVAAPGESDHHPVALHFHLPGRLHEPPK